MSALPVLSDEEWRTLKDELRGAFAGGGTLKSVVGAAPGWRAGGSASNGSAVLALPADLPHG
eukprot:12769903-Alexandrium_andersonii.AAC.1